MEYQTPSIEVVGPASELIQAYFGPRIDGDGYQFSLAISSPLEEE
jgi:hypothetical protein